MNDLISRKALLAEYDRVHVGEPGMARKLIEDAPTVDAEPVRHGRWVAIDRIAFGFPWKLRCNRCGVPQDYPHTYCPNCGAKMDGGNNDAAG